MIQTRKQKVSRLLVTIKEQSEGIEKEKLIAAICYQEGIARRTIREYLKVLETNNLIFLKDGRYFATEEKQTNA